MENKNINYQGKVIDVVEVEPVTSSENWNEYQLADGKVLSIKTVLITALKAVNEKDQDGNPLYVIKTQQIVKVK